MKVQIQKRTIVKLVSVFSMLLVVLSLFPVNAFAAMSNDTSVSASYSSYDSGYAPYGTTTYQSNLNKKIQLYYYRDGGYTSNSFQGCFYNYGLSSVSEYCSYTYSFTVSTSGSYELSLYTDCLKYKNIINSVVGSSTLLGALGSSASDSFPSFSISGYMYNSDSAGPYTPIINQSSADGSASGSGVISCEPGYTYTVIMYVYCPVDAASRVSFDSEFSIKLVSDDTTPGIDSRTTDSWVLSSIDKDGNYWYRYNLIPISYTYNCTSGVSGSDNYHSWENGVGYYKDYCVDPRNWITCKSCNPLTCPMNGTYTTYLYISGNISIYGAYSDASYSQLKVYGTDITDNTTTSYTADNPLVESINKTILVKTKDNIVGSTWDPIPNIQIVGGSSNYTLGIYNLKIYPLIKVVPATATTINNYNTTYTITNNNTYNTQNIFNTTENKAYYDIDNSQYCTYTNYYYDTNTYTYYYADDDGDYGSTTYTDNSTVTYYYDNSTGDTVTNVYYYNEYNYSDDSSGGDDSGDSGDSGSSGDTDDIIIDDSDSDNPFSLTSLIKALLNFFVVVLKGFWKIISGVLDTIISSVGTFFDSFSSTGVFQFFNRDADSGLSNPVSGFFDFMTSLFALLPNALRLFIILSFGIVVFFAVFKIFTK